jgi:cytochrome o ubiquinol oxidase subunit 2
LYRPADPPHHRDAVRRSGVGRARVITTAALLLPLAGCSQLLDPAGPVGHGEKIILLDALAIMLCIVVPVIVATLGFAFWYRAGNKRAEFRPDFVYSGRIELVTWSIPLLTILFLGGLTWVASHELDPFKPVAAAPGGEARPLEIQVVALDWKWLFVYPEQGVASVNRLVLPIGRPVHFRITSASVMNAFFVPRLGSMIYAMNGMETQLWLRADAPGRYRGLSSNFSGDGFSDMHFATDALSPAQFGRWAADTAHATPLDAAAYKSLERQGTVPRPFAYGRIQPHLFDAIVTQKLPPAAGPPPSVSPGRR